MISKSKEVKYFIIAVAMIALLALDQTARADEPAVRHGEVRFEPVANEEQVVPAAFRLTSQTFAFEQAPSPASDADVVVSLVTFPSPVKTAEEKNNTVHCEFYRPAKPGKYPAVVVLHIMGGDFFVARMFADQLARQGVAALFLQMPYYGDRRTAGSKARMVSTDARETVAGMTQAVKDIRYAAAWLGAQEEVDANQLGVFGISLGGITASLAATAEPRFTKVCPLLAGGDLALVLRGANEKHIVAAKDRWTAEGHSLDELVELMKTVDPCNYAGALRGRHVLMLNALHDEIIPRACTDSLWEAYGRPQIVWYDCGHYTAIWHLADALVKVGKFFSGEATSN